MEDWVRGLEIIGDPCWVGFIFLSAMFICEHEFVFCFISILCGYIFMMFTNRTQKNSMITTLVYARTRVHTHAHTLTHIHAHTHITHICTHVHVTRCCPVPICLTTNLPISTVHVHIVLGYNPGLGYQFVGLFIRSHSGTGSGMTCIPTTLGCQTTLYGICEARCFYFETKCHEQCESEVVCLYFVIIWYFEVAKCPVFTKKSSPLTYL